MLAEQVLHRATGSLLMGELLDSRRSGRRAEVTGNEEPVSSTRNSPTLRDVARLAGVSQSAVSRAFTEGASISPLTYAKVVDAAEALGYRPNLLARSLITGRSKLIGVAASNLENSLFPHVLDMLSARLSETGHRLMVYAMQSDPAVNEAQLSDLVRYQLHGMIFLAIPEPQKLGALFARDGVPAVYFNQPPGPSDTEFGVEGEGEEGARKIARFLLDAGHRRIAFMAGLPGPVNQVRETGFFNEMASLGAERPMRVVGGFNYAKAMVAARELFFQSERPDAIFCANDQMALATIAVAQSEFGLVVGRDVAIVGFGDVPMASWSNFSLTTYSLPLAAMVDKVIDILLGDIPLPCEQRRIVFPGRLIVRESAPRFRPLVRAD